MFIENIRRFFDLLESGALIGPLLSQTPADELNQRLASSRAQLPESVVVHTADLFLNIFERSTPSLLTAGFCPEAICFRRIPSGNMHAICHMINRHFHDWPAWK